ncbi:hypothetical protein MY4824_005223 [Beauveria thailandica]
MHGRQGLLTIALFQIDLPPGLGLVDGLSLVLIPPSLTGLLKPGRWREASVIAMVVVGAVLLVSFVVWDVKVAKMLCMPARMANRTVTAAACLT